MNEHSKICTKCGTEKDFSCFGKHKLCRYGLNSVCKECDRKLKKEFRDTHKAHIKAQKEELVALDMYYNRPPEELIWLKRKDHSKMHKCKVVK